MTEAKKTNDHKLIQRWAEARSGRFATVKGTLVLPTAISRGLLNG